MYDVNNTTYSRSCGQRGVKQPGAGKPHVAPKNHTRSSADSFRPFLEDSDRSWSVLSARVMRRAELGDVLKWRDVAERKSVGHTRVWGPVLAGAAARVGSLRDASSVVIIPEIATHISAAALQCVPGELLPRADDSAETLAARVGASAFLDDAHVLNKGNGKRGHNGQKRRRLNESCMAAPRRKTWSVVVGAEQVDEDGCEMVQLFNYSAFGRVAEDVRSAPMPLPVFALGEQVWLAAMPYLCEASRRNPPTHCQLLLYYVLFQSHMGRHRDNYTVRHLRATLEGGEAAGSTHANMENSQRLGSEVLLYTEGPTPMDFALSFPPKDDLGCGRQEYVRRACFTVRLGRGTLMVFKDCDDQFFCHEAEFSAHVLRQADASGCRLCFVFRWCTSVKNFRVAPDCSFKSGVPPPGNVVDV